MPPLVFGLVGLSMVLHVAWNALLRTSADPLATSARSLLTGVALTAPIALVGWWLAGRPGLTMPVWGLVGGSAFLELLYFTTLSAAYRRGDLSVVYPLARGTAPVLAVVVGVTLLDERLPPIALVGVMLLLVGGWAVRQPSMAGAAVPWALACGCTIAAYSAVDRVAVRLVDPLLYGWLLMAITAGLLFVGLAVRRWTRQRKAGASVAQEWQLEPEAVALPGAGWSGPRGPLRDILVGILLVVSYMLVLTALSIAPLAAVSPLRESSVVIAALWGVLVLRERAGAAARIGGSVLIGLGAALLVAGS